MWHTTYDAPCTGVPNPVGMLRSRFLRPITDQLESISADTDITDHSAKSADPVITDHGTKSIKSSIYCVTVAAFTGLDIKLFQVLVLRTSELNFYLSKS